MPDHKTVLTQRLAEIAGDISAEQAAKEWYYNLRPTGGMRLTLSGYKAFQDLELEHWSVPIDPKKFNKRVLLDLDRRLQYPYYIDGKRKELVLFSSREALMATLYGDLQKWLDSLGSDHE